MIDDHSLPCHKAYLTIDNVNYCFQSTAYSSTEVSGEPESHSLLFDSDPLGSLFPPYYPRIYKSFALALALHESHYYRLIAFLKIAHRVCLR